jgi:quinol-cytochrome oxidoreductase complex cytochrome b subunit
MAGRGFLEHLHPPRPDPMRVRTGHTFCLGGLSFLLFLILAASGGVLMFIYAPIPRGAADFFAQETGGLPFAWFFRRVHFLAGQAMVIALILHMLRVLLTGAYLPPRAGNWAAGILLLALTLALDLSGYVLRWDEPTRAAAAVTGQLAGMIPGVGALFKRLLLAGDALNRDSLLRFYVLHCLALPGAVFGLCLYHFWRIRKDGRPRTGL